MKNITVLKFIIFVTLINISLYFYFKKTNLNKKISLTEKPKKHQQTLNISYSPLETYQKLPRKNQQHYKLVIGITSAPSYRAKRDAIRKTWLSPRVTNGYSIFYLFIVGNSTIERENQSLMKEMSEFSDILLIPMVDSYRSSTLKVMTYFHWLSYQEQTGNFSFDWVMKAVDDSWFNMELALAELEHMVPKRLIWGNFPLRGPVIRNPVSPNYENNFDSNEYPAYATGAGYIISRDLVYWLSLQWNQGLVFQYSNDDTAVGIYLSAVNPWKINDVKRWWWWERPEEFKNARSINCARSVLVHPLTPLDIFQRQKNWDECRSVCLCSQSWDVLEKIAGKN